jgi:hypothetical protein
MIKLIFANKGAGKTTLLAKLAQKELKKIKKGKSKYDVVLSNAPIEGVYYTSDLRAILKVFAVENVLILLEEGGSVYNNRKMNMTDREIQFIKLSRHYITDFIIVSQADDIDLTIRRVYDDMSFLSRLPLVSLERPIHKYVMIDDMTHQIVDGYRWCSVLSWRFTFRPRWYQYFNTYWRPSDVPIFNIKENLPIMPKMDRQKSKIYLYLYGVYTDTLMGYISRINKQISYIGGIKNIKKMKKQLHAGTALLREGVLNQPVQITEQNVQAQQNIVESRKSSKLFNSLPFSLLKRKMKNK